MEGQINTSHTGAHMFIISRDLVADCAGYTRFACSLIQSDARALSCRDNHSSTSTRTKDFTHSYKRRLSDRPSPTPAV